MHRLAIVVPLLLASACNDAEPILTIEGTGFAAYDGAQVHVALIRPDRTEIVDLQEVTIRDGVVFAEWRGPLEDVAYRVDLYVDADADDSCEFGADPTYSLAVPAVSESVNIGFTLTGPDDYGCMSFGAGSVKLHGWNFTPDRVVYAALVRQADDEVIETRDAVTAHGEFFIEWAGRVEGATFYRVDYFVDLDMDGECEAGVDEGPWRLLTGASGEVSSSGLSEWGFEFEVDGADTTTSAACGSFAVSS